MSAKRLSHIQMSLVESIAQSARRSIIAMLAQSQSGHPGGSLSCIDYLALVYSQIIVKTGEPVVVSNGHISPAVYAILAELGIADKQDVIDSFRTPDSAYEGHVAREVRGVVYGTGPLGAGVSAASGIAWANRDQHCFALVGDGESQEGQVYEMMHTAAKYKLNNLIVFMDYNQVQLTDSVKEVMPINPKETWQAAGWKVIEVDGHDIQKMWTALQKAMQSKTKPVLLLAHTIMGKGVAAMEATGKRREATWHGKAPSHQLAEEILDELTLSKKQATSILRFQKSVRWKPKAFHAPALGTPMKIKTGKATEYGVDVKIDCRTAYGKALLDLAKRNKQIVALTADLAKSVKTSYVRDAFPERHIDVGVAEQQMLSMAGGISVAEKIPFCSTFGAFMTSRAKDQARLNDLNHTNVKMVATHCGLSVGKDGPTHQAIDDMGSFLGLLHTAVMEPADPNHCDRMIRYAASHYGNMYIRMGREKIPVLTKENGKVFYDKNYVYRYGAVDRLRKGEHVTVVASGPMVSEALCAWERLTEAGTRVDLLIASSPKAFDATLWNSLKKTRKLLVVEDHNTLNGFGSQILRQAALKEIALEKVKLLGVEEYQRSGTAAELYKKAGIDGRGIYRRLRKLVKR